MRNALRALAFVAIGAFLGAASVAATAAPALPVLAAQATVTAVHTAIGSDPAAPAVTVDASVNKLGAFLGGTCSFVTAGHPAAERFVPGATVKLVLGGR